MPNQSFHFSLGPVQGFVAQARRTRDLWTGSYLLSYLSGIAMLEVKKFGEIVFPKIDDDLLIKAIRGDYQPGIDDPAARIGSLPNRFKASAENQVEAAKAAELAIDITWGKITDTVWNELKRRVSHLLSDYTKEVWDRQVNNLWEVIWVIEDDRDDGSCLDRRKNFRIHFHKEEPGEKCTLCGEREVLSDAALQDRQAVREWWSQVADEFNRKKGYHFLRRDRERLCAVCTVKRMFTVVSTKAIGWKVYHNYPSTAYVSAVDWLKITLKKSNEDAVKQYLGKFIKLADAADVPYDEEATKIISILELLENKPAEWKKITDFRGDVFFPDAIKNTKDFTINEKTDPAIREKLVNALTELTNAVESSPTPFYALLLMDGDNMGKLLSENKDQQGAISEALLDFTKQVTGIVEVKHDGKLIYAGGDDVFALLPLNTALSCAKELREAYVSSFRRNVPDVKGGTISAGIVYAHMNTHLQAVVKDAHQLLDKIAKDKLGRDAFAVRVWKRGGPILEFGKRWVDRSWVDEILQLKESFTEKKMFSNSFFYRFQELLPILEIMDGDGSMKLMTSEFMKSREQLGMIGDKEERLQEAEKRVNALLELSLSPDGKGNMKRTSDGAMFIRFLSQKEVR